MYSGLHTICLPSIIMPAELTNNARVSNRCVRNLQRYCHKQEGPGVGGREQARWQPSSAVAGLGAG